MLMTMIVRCSGWNRLCCGRTGVALSLVALPLLSANAWAQDGRLLTGPTSTQNGVLSVAEPTFPANAGCSTVAAETTVQSSGEPASETVDTLIQPALTAAKSSSTCKVVELTLNSNGNDAFVINPIAIPSGVTLIVDGGVTVFATLNAAAYQVGTVSGTQDQCGVNGSNGNGCYALISLGQSTVGGGSSSSGSGLMGYGVINGRGYDAPVVSGITNTTSWWQLANNAQTNGNSQNNFILVQTSNASSLTVYKITLENSPMFHMKLSGGTGVTVWGLKIITPWTGRNTDGVDPSGVTNMSVVNSVIGDGDDEIAISGSSAATGFSFTNLTLPSGHGVSIGSITTNGVSNVLATNLNFSGQALDGNQEGLRIKSYCGKGGTVNNVTYNNVCMQNVATAIDLNPYYSSTSTTTGCPAFTNVTYQNLYILGNYSINFQGLHNSAATNTSTITLNNVYVNNSALKLSTSNGVATPSYDNITLAGTSFYPNAWSTLSTATGASNVTETPSSPAPTLASAFPTAFCAGVFPSLMGELYASSTSGGTTTNLRDQAFTVTNPSSITLNGMLLPVNSEVSYKPSGQSTGYTAVAAPSTATLPIQFYDGATLAGTGTLSSNGTFVTAPVITNPSVGTHTYTAKFQGDTNYAAFPFGSLTVTVNAGAASQLAFATAPPATLVYGTAPGTVTVAVQDSVGDTTASTASVTLTATGPSSYSQVYTASAVNGVATFNLTSSLPGVGSYSYVASSGGLTSTGSASESVTAATLTVAAQPASRIFGNPNPGFSYQISGFVNNDPASVVSGAPVLTTTAVRNSPATTYPIAVAVGSLIAANYSFATTGNTLTVTGGAPQMINFVPLPNFAHPGVYQLTASTTSGLPVTYSVTGPASVNGAVLTVSGAGTVTVTAAAASNINYAAANSVQQQFMAQ